jgi:hypothetical protein
VGLGKGLCLLDPARRDRKCLGEPGVQQAAPSRSCRSGEKARQQWWELKGELAALSLCVPALTFRPTSEEALKWSESLEKLLLHKCE